MTHIAVLDPLRQAAKSDPFAGSRYRAVELLASGATGDLYVVEHLELGKCFAAKLLHADQMLDARAADRLRLEAQSLGRLRHPNIVAITGFERTHDSRPFIVMELLKGRTLTAELDARPDLPRNEALDWASHLLSALEVAHANGIVHRDICPKNVFLHQTQAGTVVPKLVDFGSVRVQPGKSPSTPPPLAVPTQTGNIWVSPELTSPELALGRPADVRSDIFQFGLLLNRMLTKPGACLPPKLKCIVHRATAYDPDARYQSANDLRRELSELSDRDLFAPTRLGAGTVIRALLFLGLAALVALIVFGAACLLGARL